MWRFHRPESASGMPSITHCPDRFATAVTTNELLQKLAMGAMTGALRNGSAQINADFASLSRAYARDATRKITMAQTSRDNQLSIARYINQARLEIAATGVN
jgi:hypothetical protein